METFLFNSYSKFRTQNFIFSDKKITLCLNCFNKKRKVIFKKVQICEKVI